MPCTRVVTSTAAPSAAISRGSWILRDQLAQSTGSSAFAWTSAAMFVSDPSITSLAAARPACSSWIIRFAISAMFGPTARWTSRLRPYALLKPSARRRMCAASSQALEVTSRRPSWRAPSTSAWSAGGNAGAAVARPAGAAGAGAAGAAQATSATRTSASRAAIRCVLRAATVTSSLRRGPAQSVVDRDAPVTLDEAQDSAYTHRVVTHMRRRSSARRSRSACARRPESPGESLPGRTRYDPARESTNGYQQRSLPEAHGQWPPVRHRTSKQVHARRLPGLPAHRPGHARRPLPATLLAAGVLRLAAQAGPRGAASRDERGLHPLSRRGRLPARGGLPLRAPRDAALHWLGRGRLYPLLLPRLEVRRDGAVRRDAG